MLFQIRLHHIDWLYQTGQELDRKCEFAAALKYYYAGKVYYSKLDEFGSQPGYDSSKLSTITEGFKSNPDGLYVEIYRALQAVAIKNKDWAEKHPGILLGTWAHADADGKLQERQVCHLKDCLCPQDAEPCLEVVR